jgi:intracellular sulfur oxidation DsrE/DsrF family protein
MFTTNSNIVARIEIRHKITSIRNHVWCSPGVHISLITWRRNIESMHNNLNVCWSIRRGSLVTSLVQCSACYMSLMSWLLTKNTNLLVEFPVVGIVNIYLEFELFGLFGFCAFVLFGRKGITRFLKIKKCAFLRCWTK